VKTNPAIMIFLFALSAGANAFPSANVAETWNSATLQGIRDAKLGAPVVARALAIAHTCMYDAWAAYDERAIGTQLGGALRRPASERTLANKEQAISYAANILGSTSVNSCVAKATQTYLCNGRTVGTFTLTNTYTKGILNGQAVTNVTTTKQ
jgi:hypothetical protein